MIAEKRLEDFSGYNNFSFYPDVTGDSEKDTVLLKKDISDAISYLENQSWFKPIKRIALTFGIGGIASVLLVEFIENVNDSDRVLWVICGDIPVVYLVVDSIKDKKEALKVYCTLMLDWCNSVIFGRSMDGVFPVESMPTLENAKDLQKRINYINREIIPMMQN